MISHIRTLGVAVVVLAISTSVKSADPQEARSRNRSPVCVVVQAEYQALAPPGSTEVCLSVRGKDPPRDTLRKLREGSIKIEAGSVCTRQPHGILISVEKLTRGRGKADAVVESMDMNLGDSHFATLLRRGVYHLTLTKGVWSVESYTPSSK